MNSSNLVLLPYPGPNLDSLGIMEEVEMGSLRPVHPSLSPSRREVLGQPFCLSHAYSHLSLTYSHLSLTKPCRLQDSDWLRHNPIHIWSPEGRNWTHIKHIQEDTHKHRCAQTHTNTYRGVGWEWGLTKPYTG